MLKTPGNAYAVPSEKSIPSYARALKKSDNAPSEEIAGKPLTKTGFHPMTGKLEAGGEDIERALSKKPVSPPTATKNDQKTVKNSVTITKTENQKFNQKNKDYNLKHENISQDNNNQGDRNSGNGKETPQPNNFEQQQLPMAAAAMQAGQFYPQMMPATNMQHIPGQMPGHMPVVYMMPTTAPGQYQPVMAAAPPGWQMPSTMPMQMMQMPTGMPGMAYAPVQPVQYFQEVPVHYGQNYHKQKRGSLTFNPLKNGNHGNANKDRRNHSNGSGSNGSHSHGSHSTSTHREHNHGHHHHHNKDKKKDNSQKRNKSHQSSTGCSDSANKSNNSRTNSSGSDLSLGCSASQNGGAKCMRSCSHDSGVSHKTPETTTSQAGRTNSQHSCDGKTSIAATVNGDASEERNLSVNSDGTPKRRFSNQTEFKKPDAELIVKIIDLIEFYLSDEYLAKDKYLLRQIRCKSEGYISIKLMTSFKKVKKLTRDWRAVRYALLKSKNLEISPEGFRVKRASALPDALRKPRLLSSVVSIRLPLEYQSVDAITQLFSKYGEIGLVRLLKPGKEIPSDLRNYATQVPDIGKSLCAVVDFEQSDAALQAVRCLKEKLMESGMRLALLGPRVRRTLYKQDRGDGENSVCDESSVIDDQVLIDQKLVDQKIEKKLDEVAKNNNLEIKEEKTNKSVADSEAGATTETPETEVETAETAEGIIKALQSDIKSDMPQKTENLKIKSKVSIILREPKCPSQSNNGFSQARTTTCQ